MHDGAAGIETAIIQTDVPARLDRLPWSAVPHADRRRARHHLDSRRAGSHDRRLDRRRRCRKARYCSSPPAQVGLVASAYLVGAVIGAVLFGYLTDRFGRRKLFMITLGLYLAATAATALSWDFWSFAVLPRADRRRHRRRIRGDQLGDPGADPGPLARPHRPRDQRQLLDRRGARRAWARSCCSIPAGCRPIGAGGPRSASARCSGSASSYLRRCLPESPRWLMLHGRLDECETVISEIERRVCEAAGHRTAAGPPAAFALSPTAARPVLRVVRTIFHDYPRRALLGLVLMASQAFFYNAIFFTYALVLTKFYGVAIARDRLVHAALRARQFPRAAAARAAVRHDRPQADDRRHLCAVGHAAGDRRLAVPRGPARRRDADRCAGAASSSSPRRRRAPPISRSSESFPLEMRALAIAFFYAIGTGSAGSRRPGCSASWSAAASAARSISAISSARH